MSEIVHKEVSYEIVGAAIDVWKALGYGFLEKVYENALVIELRLRGLEAERQKPIKVLYRDNIVGKYFADVLVNGNIILEIKTAETISTVYIAQTLNYLKATNHRLGIILNFGPHQMEHKRLVF